jgi:hypothetical protein
VIFLTWSKWDVNADQLLECKIGFDDHHCQVVHADFSKASVGSQFTFSSTRVEAEKTTAIEFNKIGQVVHLPENLWQTFPNLISMSIQSSVIPIVKYKLFSSVFEKLQALSLSHNRIKIVEARAFAYLRNLVRIDLSNNEIRSLEQKMFEGNRKLKWIDLSWNKINIIIDPEIFNDLNQLRWVALRENECIDQNIGCSDCGQIDHTHLGRYLQPCFEKFTKSLDLLNQGEPHYFLTRFS